MTTGDRPHDRPGVPTLLDFRRRTTELYAAVRAQPDAREAHALWVRGREELFAGHPDSAFRGALRHAPYDPAWRFVVPVQRTEPERLAVETGTDGLVTYDRVGRVTLPGVGRLDVWWLAGYAGGLWLPLRDPAPGSYPGGRYLLDTAKGADLGEADGALVVDLNFAYNPSCAYDARWACPLAPPGNVVDVAVPVGEQRP